MPHPAPPARSPFQAPVQGSHRDARRWSPTPLVVAVLLASAGCSHATPWVAPAVDRARVRTPPAPDRIRARLLLIGDAGEPAPEREPVLTALRDTASHLPDRTWVVFLGDNAYEDGIPPADDPDRAEAERRLGAQLDVVRQSGARGLLIPGNHDWDRGGPEGLGNVLRMQEAVDRAGGDRIRWLPRDGCPGPVALDDAPGVRIVVLDTQWLFHDHERPGPAKCGLGEAGDVGGELPHLLRGAGARPTVVLAHHPLRTQGHHGGFDTWDQHLFPLRAWKEWMWLPLPGLGSFYPLVWKPLHREDQDLDHPEYRSYVRAMTRATAGAPPLVWASGHEHSLEVLRGGDAAAYLLVSGAGSASKVTAVGDGPDTLFALAGTGFMALDFLEDGRTLLRVVTPGDGVPFGTWLEDASGEEIRNTAPGRGVP